MTWSAWPSSRVVSASSRSSTARCSGPCSSSTSTSESPPGLADRARSASGSRSRIAAARAVRHRQEPPDLLREVRPQPRHRGELQPVGGLVQAHPHAEVRARHVQRLLRRVARSARRAAGGPRRRCRRTGRTGRGPGRRGRRARRRPAGRPSRAVTARATFGVCGRRAPAVSAAMPSIAAAAQAGRSTTSAGSSGSPSPSPVTARTWPSATAASARSLRTSSTAASRLTGGPAGTSRAAVRRASAQSTGRPTSISGSDAGAGVGSEVRRTRPTLRASGASARPAVREPPGAARSRLAAREAQLAVSGNRSGQLGGDRVQLRADEPPGSRRCTSTRTRAAGRRRPTTTPARLLTPVSVPVFARTTPAARGRRRAGGEPVVQGAVAARHRQPGEDRPQELGVARALRGGRRRGEHRAEQLRGHPVLRGEAAAVDELRRPPCRMPAWVSASHVACAAAPSNEGSPLRSIAISPGEHLGQHVVRRRGSCARRGRRPVRRPRCRARRRPARRCPRRRVPASAPSSLAKRPPGRQRRVGARVRRPAAWGRAAAVEHQRLDRGRRKPPAMSAGSQLGCSVGPR